MPVSAEEKGLLGSKYYAENPIYPLENTIANLNVDMIGRIDDYHNNPNYIYLIGSDRLSVELHEISEAVNDKYINLDLIINITMKMILIDIIIVQTIITLLRIIFL